MISSGTSSGDSQSGPGLKWARYCLPPSRRPLTITIPRVIRARVAVIQTLPVAAPPMLAPKIRAELIGSRPSRFTVKTKKKTVQMNLMKLSVYGPRAGRAISSRKYWQIASMALPAPVGTMASIPALPRRRRVHAGISASSSAAAISIMTMWLSSRVILPPGVRNPRLAGRWIIGCRTMCSSGFSDSMRKASIEKFSVPF